MTAALIVAAGRTGSKAQLAPEKKTGMITAIERVALLFQQAGIRRIVVVCDGDGVKKLAPSMNLTFLTSPIGGEMLDSVKTGLAYLQGKCRRAFISYVDVPLFSLRTVRALLDAGGGAAVPSYNGRGGHPILLEAAVFGSVLSYTGGDGLKGAIDASGAERRFVAVDDPGIVSDIQKDDSYESLLPGHDAAKLRAAFQFRICRECVFYGPGAHQLLQLTRELGSLSDACRHMGISYSKGRKIIANMERQMGGPVIETQQGGKGGGGSRLTQRAAELMERYDAFCLEAEDALQILFQKHFATQSDEVRRTEGSGL